MYLLAQLHSTISLSYMHFLTHLTKFISLLSDIHLLHSITCISLTQLYFFPSLRYINLLHSAAFISFTQLHASPSLSYMHLLIQLHSSTHSATFIPFSQLNVSPCSTTFTLLHSPRSTALISFTQPHALLTQLHSSNSLC